MTEWYAIESHFSTQRTIIKRLLHVEHCECACVHTHLCVCAHGDGGGDEGNGGKKCEEY